MNEIYMKLKTVYENIQNSIQWPKKLINLSIKLL